jgi:hypothetical protein
VHTLEFATRRAAKNPVHPYRWEARYAGGGRLCQYDVDGMHRSPEIELSRVSGLVIYGHPSGPLRVTRRWDCAPSEVIIRSRVRIMFGESIYRTVEHWFGFRYPTGSFEGWRIQPQSQACWLTGQFFPS